MSKDDLGDESQLTESETIKNAKYVETLFKPAVTKEICR